MRESISDLMTVMIPLLIILLLSNYSKSVDLEFYLDTVSNIYLKFISCWLETQITFCLFHYQLEINWPLFLFRYIYFKLRNINFNFIHVIFTINYFDSDSVN